MYRTTFKYSNLNTLLSKNDETHNNKRTHFTFIFLYLLWEHKYLNRYRDYLHTINVTKRFSCISE